MASTVVAGVSAIKQGQAEQKAENFNAAVARDNAQSVEDDKLTVSKQASIDRRRLGVQAQADAGNLRASAAAMGLNGNFGSFDDLQKDVAQKYSIDSSIISANEVSNLRNLDREQASYTNQATLDAAAGKNAKEQGDLSAVGSLLKGASSVSSMWMQPPAASGPIQVHPITAKPLPAYRPLPLNG